MVPNTATIIPIKPSTCQPTRIAALTAIAPGEDCANAVISSISCSSIQCSSSTNFFFISVTITYPPPKVNALRYKVDKNSFNSNFFLVLFSGILSILFLRDFFKIIFKSSICYIVTQIIQLHNRNFSVIIMTNVHKTLHSYIALFCAKRR